MFLWTCVILYFHNFWIAKIQVKSKVFKNIDLISDEYLSVSWFATLGLS